MTDADKTSSACSIADAFLLGESLEPDDRLRLIAQLWASLPADHWAAPTETELAELERRLGNYDTDGLAIVPWKIMRQMAASRPDPVIVPAKIYSAPRRFDLATIFAVMSAYSLLFALMSGFPPMVSVAIGAFITIVGVCQALLFGGRKPRVASIVTGATLFFLAGLAFERFLFLYAPLWIVLGVMGWVGMGAVCGYLAGVLVGGVFLVADGVRKAFDRFMKRNRNEELEAEAT